MIQELSLDIFVHGEQKPAEHTLKCHCCGNVFQRGKRGPAAKFCSEKCRDAQKASEANKRTCSGCGSHYDKPYGKLGLRKFCSSACKQKMEKRWSFEIKHRRRARKRAQDCEVFWRKEIFDRDFYFCMICGGKTDALAKVPHPLAPTVDHILPIAKGGGHTRANTQTAHFICNSLKSDRMQVGGHSKCLGDYVERPHMVS